MLAIVLPLYIFDCSVQSEFERNGAFILEETEFFRRLPSPLGEKYCLQDGWKISLTITNIQRSSIASVCNLTCVNGCRRPPYPFVISLDVITAMIVLC